MLRKVLATCCLLFLALLSGRATGTFVPRLSPLPVGLQGQKISLNGEWHFHPSPEAGFNGMEKVGNWKTIQVPGEWVMQGFEVKKGEAAGYVREFTLPESWKGQRVKLRCNAVYSDCKVFVNGRKAGSHLGGFTAFELDVTDLVVYGGTNRVALSVASESIADATSNASNYAVHPLGGITRDIYLFALPEVNLSMFHVSTSFDSTYTDAILKTEVAVSNESSEKADGLTVSFILKDADGKAVALSSASYPVPVMEQGKTETLDISLPVPNPVKWDSEHPYLYTLVCQLKNKQGIVVASTRRVGFRQIEVRGNQVFVNNHPIKLRGVCRHEVMPLRGRSLCDGMWRKDVELFRRGNVNYIRTSHYPPDEALLEACDELGMFVEVEAPFCWAHQADVPDDKHDDVLVNQHVEMVNLNRSHPSVLMWSMGNESLKFEEYFKQAAETVRKIDPTRPRIFSQWGPDADGGMLEITNHHYPGPEGPDTYRNHKRPVTFDEFCHLNAYNRLELAADPGLRTMWGDLLDAMWSDMYHSRGVLGGAIWVGIDDTFFLPGEKAVGYGTWGTIDGWRREKPEYWGMKKAYSPVKITLKGNMDREGRVGLHVENRHLFSNLSECRITWEADGVRGDVAGNIAPRSEGELEIVLPEALRRAEKLDLTVTGVRGFEIDRYSFRLLPESKTLAPKRSGKKLLCRETEEQIGIDAGECRFVVGKRDGLLTVVSRDEEKLLCSPSLMVLPLNGEGEGIQMTGKDQTFAPFNPVCQNWVAQSVEYIPAKEKAEVIVRGSYKEAEGKFCYRFYPDGTVTVDYDFTLLQDVSPRQTGLVFTVPSGYTRLSWERKGYWNVYPEGHIGALKGTAKAFDDALPLSGLAGPSKEPSVAWSFDQTVNGSNIFRSTKENIYTAVLSADGRGDISVLSDGTQHFRAWIDGSVVRFLVAGYTNAGSDTYLVSHAKKGYRPLRKGDSVKGTVRLSF